MNVGVITYHSVYNFGANLQAFATSGWLKTLGHDVHVLDYRPPDLITKYRNTVPSSQAALHEAFCGEYLPLTSRCESSSDLARVSKALALQCVITGSDAVLRLNYELNRADTTFPNPFWLQWVPPGTRRVALAASSMGTSYFGLRRQVRTAAGRALREFDGISVRDLWTRLLVIAMTRGRVWPQVLGDPLFLLEPPPETASLSVDGQAVQRGAYVLLSAYPGQLSDDWVRDFLAAAHARSLKVYELPNPEGPAPLPVDGCVQMPLDPLTWFRWIRNAAGYVGVRFHPVVAAISSEVPFLALDTYQRRAVLPYESKTYDLCRRAGLSNRCPSRIQRRLLTGEGAVSRVLSQEHYAQKVRQYRKAVLAQYERFLHESGLGRPAAQLTAPP